MILPKSWKPILVHKSTITFTKEKRDKVYKDVYYDIFL